MGGSIPTYDSLFGNIEANTMRLANSCREYEAPARKAAHAHATM
jgi:hypothetical protein